MLATTCSMLICPVPACPLLALDSVSANQIFTQVPKTFPKLCAVAVLELSGRGWLRLTKTKSLQGKARLVTSSEHKQNYNISSFYPDRNLSGSLLMAAAWKHKINLNCCLNEERQM